MASFFQNASHIHFSGYQSFSNTHNTVINNFNYPAHTGSEYGLSRSRVEEQWLTLPGGQQRLRWVDMCDIKTLREVSLQTVNVDIKYRALKPTNPFRARLESQGGTVKIKKRIQSAEIVQLGERKFTIVSFETKNVGDTEKIRTVLLPIYEFVLSQRQMSLLQLFGVGRSTIPTLIYHDELVSGEDIKNQYLKKPIVYHYLVYRRLISCYSVKSERTLEELSIAVSKKSSDWMFNYRTHSFQYDIASHALSGGPVTHQPFPKPFADYTLPPPPQRNPRLTSKGILRVLPDYLELVADIRETIYVKNLTDFVRHDVLTFGAIIDRTKPGILGYLPSTPSPKRKIQNKSPNIVIKRSKSVRTLLDLTFMKKTNVQMNLHFNIRLKAKDRRQLRTAYLAQSLPFYKGGVPGDLVLVDTVRVALIGTFASDLSSRHRPIYLHVPPLSHGRINGMPSLDWPVMTTSPLFYWSSDPEGKQVISEEDWGRYEIPKLRVETWIGSCWWGMAYKAVRTYLRLKKYDLSGEQFAKEHRYPILVTGDPHDVEQKGSSGKKKKKKGKDEGDGMKSVDTPQGHVGQASIAEISG